MSLTRKVPWSVPSVLHNSVPCRDSTALKNSTFPDLANPEGDRGVGDDDVTTIVVPAAVPSLFHSSYAWPLKALNNRRSFSTAKSEGFEPVGPTTISFTRSVPPAVPSLFQSSRP